MNLTIIREKKRTSMTFTLNIQNESKNKFSEFTEIWKDRDITQESIREQAWR